MSSMTPNIMTPVNISVDSKEPVNPVAMLPTKNMEIMEIIVGKRSVARNKIIGEHCNHTFSCQKLLILQPTAPAALQPNPITRRKRLLSASIGLFKIVV